MVTTLAKSMDPSDMPPCQRLGELSALLAGGLLRLWLKRRKEREISPDNCLGCPGETRPTAVDL
jgi:hypothetical protein